jgi:hypothetical protein
VQDVALSGERDGQRDVRVAGGTHNEPFVMRLLCADFDGFSLHGAVRAAAGDRKRVVSGNSAEPIWHGIGVLVQRFSDDACGRFVRPKLAIRNCNAPRDSGEPTRRDPVDHELWRCRYTRAREAMIATNIDVVLRG